MTIASQGRSRSQRVKILADMLGKDFELLQRTEDELAKMKSENGFLKREVERMERVQVVDATNTRRVLGEVYKRDLPIPQEAGARSLGLMVAHLDILGTALFDAALMPMAPTMEKAYRVDLSIDVQDMNVVLRTDTPLGVLLMWPHFMLPGETQTEAQERFYNASHGIHHR